MAIRELKIVERLQTCPNIYSFKHLIVSRFTDKNRSFLGVLWDPEELNNSSDIARASKINFSMTFVICKQTELCGTVQTMISIQFDKSLTVILILKQIYQHVGNPLNK